MGMDFNRGDNVMVDLQSRYFVQQTDFPPPTPFAQREEVSLYSMTEIKNRLGLEGLTWKAVREMFQAKQILPVHNIAGTYIGWNRSGIKVRPFFGLANPAAYFILKPEQIESITLLRTGANRTKYLVALVRGAEAACSNK
jgi:hypothetical protein